MRGDGSLCERGQSPFSWGTVPFRTGTVPSQAHSQEFAQASSILNKLKEPRCRAGVKVFELEKEGL